MELAREIKLLCMYVLISLIMSFKMQRLIYDYSNKLRLSENTIIHREGGGRERRREREGGGERGERERERKGERREAKIKGSYQRDLYHNTIQNYKLLY